MPILTRRCPSGHEWNLLDFKGLSNLDRPDIDNLTCPQCDEVGESVIALGMGIELGGSAGAGRDYPYFDRALTDPDTHWPGVWVQSAQHRRQLCKRLGVAPLDGAEIGFEDQVSDQRHRDAENARRIKEHEDRLYNGPNGGANRRARDIINSMSPEEIELWGQKNAVR